VAVPKFYFHTENGERVADTDGSDLADIAAAEDAAVQILSETLRGNSKLFWENEGFSVTVTDDQGLTLFSLQVSATIAAAISGRHQDRSRPS
jgi:hypothetical protein